MKLTISEFRKWQEWAQQIKGDIENRLVYPRQLFRGFNEAVMANAAHVEDHDGGFFVSFVRQCYASHVAMAVRRHVKDGKDSISLMRLLLQVHCCAPQFTREFFLQQFPIDPSHVNWQSGAFSMFSQDGHAVSPLIVQKDIDELKAVTAQIEELADRSVAHLDNRGFNGVVTFRDLDLAVDAFDRLVCKYFNLTTGGGYSTLEPTILYRWEKIFTVPIDIRRRSGRD